jgi:hypothetical protein
MTKSHWFLVCVSVCACFWRGCMGLAGEEDFLPVYVPVKLLNHHPRFCLPVRVIQLRRHCQQLRPIHHIYQPEIY